jgi:hypothetical protein
MITCAIRDPTEDNVRQMFCEYLPKAVFAKPIVIIQNTV